MCKYSVCLFLAVMVLLNSWYLGNNSLITTCGNGSVSYGFLFQTIFCFFLVTCSSEQFLFCLLSLVPQV